jgi:uncharacterized protein YajQ (UPF0234 family)
MISLTPGKGNLAKIEKLAKKDYKNMKYEIDGKTIHIEESSSGRNLLMDVKMKKYISSHNQVKIKKTVFEKNIDSDSDSAIV